MNKPTSEENFLIEISPELHDKIKEALGDVYLEGYELHYSPYWKDMKSENA